MTWPGFVSWSGWRHLTSGWGDGLCRFGVGVGGVKRCCWFWGGKNGAIGSAPNPDLLLIRTLKKKKNNQIWVDVCVQLIFVEEFVYKFWNILGFYSFVLGIEYFGFVVLVCSWSRWIWNRNLIIWMWNLWVYGFTGDWLVCWIYFLFSWHWWRLDLVVGFVSWIWEECEEQIVMFLWKNNEK